VEGSRHGRRETEKESGEALEPLAPCRDIRVVVEGRGDSDRAPALVGRQASWSCVRGGTRGGVWMMQMEERVVALPVVL
jgi:hypothetical protein